MNKKFHYTTHTRELLSDMHTPVSVYMRLRDLGEQSALMECSDYHDAQGAHSFIAVHPLASVALSHGQAIVTLPDGTQQVLAARAASTWRRKGGAGHTGCPPHKQCDGGAATVEALHTLIDQIQVEGEGAHYFGLYGYTSFNAVRYFEPVAVKDETQAENDAPDLLYIFFRDLVVFDHFTDRMTVLTLGSERDLETLLTEMNRVSAVPYAFHAVGETTSPLTDEQHKANIRRGIAHCLRGDVFQIVLSRRFCQRYEGDDFKLYRVLRSVNPSPYLFYFDLGGFRIFGSSPETHCRIEGGRAYIDPIAGTTRRTGNAEQDRQGAEFLRHDPKENAEHVMLVDLARNDLSRSCTGVKVDFYKDVQYYSHVIHLVSRVSGTLAAGADPLRAFIDTFPAGTLSGAPKVRAMQLISDYEPHNRGAYGGCIGFIGLDGSLNQAITIRTFVSRGGMLWFQAGGGIVARSNEEYELQEVNNKLGALRRAILLAESL